MVYALLFSRTQTQSTAACPTVRPLILGSHLQMLCFLLSASCLGFIVFLERIWNRTRAQSLVQRAWQKQDPLSYRDSVAQNHLLSVVIKEVLFSAFLFFFFLLIFLFVPQILPRTWRCVDLQKVCVKLSSTSIGNALTSTVSCTEISVGSEQLGERHHCIPRW